MHGTGAVLATGAIDALCEQIVAGADRDGDVLVLCGTTLIVWTTIPESAQVPGLWTIPHTAAGKSQIGGASNAGGLFLGWVDRVVGAGDPTAVDPRRVPVWSPYVRGERTPFHDPDRRGVLDGLDLTHDAASRAAGRLRGVRLRRPPAHRAERGAGVAHRGDRRRHPGRAVDAGHRRRHRAPGGGVRRWPRARRWGRRSSARMAVGLESSITDAARWAVIERVVEPDPAWARAVEDRYRRFLRAGTARTDLARYLRSRSRLVQ